MINKDFPGDRDTNKPNRSPAGQQSDDVAIALGYDAQSMDAPTVLATGKGHKAQKILEIATKNDIAVERNPVLAQALGHLGPGEQIPPELYQVVAEVLVFVMETDRKMRNGIK